MEQNNKAFREVLNEELQRYEAHPNESTYSRLLCCIFDGIREDAFVSVPADMDWDLMTVRPRMQNGPDDREHLVVLTDPDGESYPFFVSVRLRALMRFMLNSTNCGGILLNPGEDGEACMRKELLVSAIGAVCGMLEEQSEPEKEEPKKELTMMIRRPIDEDCFSRIRARIESFEDDPDDFLILDLIDDEDLMFLQAVRCGELCHVELAFNMDDFDWDYPLILGHEMPLGEALDLLRRLCVEGASPDEIDVIQNEFRDMGFRGKPTASADLPDENGEEE